MGINYQPQLVQDFNQVSGDFDHGEMAGIFIMVREVFHLSRCKDPLKQVMFIQQFRLWSF